PTNSAVVHWTPGADGNLLSGNVSAETHFNPETENMHWKNASYDPTTKKITWEIITNYRENEIGNLIIKDTPKGNQKLIENSFTINELTINENGSISEGDSVTPNVDTD